MLQVVLLQCLFRFYASAKHSVAGGIMVLSCSSVLRTTPTDEDVQPQNFGVHTAWRKARDRDIWHQGLSTAALCQEFATKKKFVRACMHVCASRNIVNTICYRVFVTFSPNLHQRCTVGQTWMHHNLGSKGQRSRSRWNKVFWKQHFLGLLTGCLENISRTFTKLTLMVCYGTEMNAFNFEIKRSQFKVTVK